MIGLSFIGLRRSTALNPRAQGDIEILADEGCRELINENGRTLDTGWRRFDLCNQNQCPLINENGQTLSAAFPL